MDMKTLICFSVLLIAVGLTSLTKADDDDYHYLAMCDNRCDMKNRLNPFAESCDSCCRQRGFRKGKCKGFGWQYCMCKPHNMFRGLLNTIINNQMQG